MSDQGFLDISLNSNHSIGEISLNKNEIDIVKGYKIATETIQTGEINEIADDVDLNISFCSNISVESFGIAEPVRHIENIGIKERNTYF